MNATRKSVRRSDNVQLEFLLGSVRRSPRQSTRKSGSRSPPPSRESSVVRAKDRWIWAAKEISQGGEKFEYLVKGCVDFQYILLGLEKSSNLISRQING